jgi:tetratricopeptide (TPR) repeat protein
MTKNPQQLLQQAIACHQRGEFAAAEPLYRDVLAQHPHEVNALQLLGVLSHQTGRVQQAVELIRQALSHGGNHPQLHYNLAAALRDSGDTAGAIEHWQAAIRQQPNLVAAYVNLGALLEQLGRSPEAEQIYRQALQSAPAHPQLWCNLGSALHYQQRLDEAIVCYQRALELEPAFVQAHANLGIARRDARDLPAAETHFLQALSLDSRYFPAWHNLAQVRHELGQLDAAVDAYRRALELRPDAYETRLNLAAVFRDQENFGDGATEYLHAIELAPQRHEAYNNLGLFLQDHGHFAEAERCYNQALAIAPQEVETRLNRTFLWLQQGRFQAGWQEYEWRRLKEVSARPGVIPFRRWQGEPLAGKSLWIFGEQGVGDEIMFATCYPELVAAAGSCRITCDRRLAPLFARSFPAAQIDPVERGQEQWAQLVQQSCDFYTPAASALSYLRPNLASFPQRASYLAAAPSTRALWRDRFDQLGPGLKIGVSWRGGAESKSARIRSTTLTDWLPLLHVPQCHFVNLQYGVAAEELAQLTQRHGAKLHHWEDSNPLTDLDGFAAQVAELDLVISVANATVHLAGALGVPTWILLPKFWGWRWLLGRTDSPWYPSVEVMRQSVSSDWGGLMALVRQRLLRQAQFPGELGKSLTFAREKLIS